MTVAQIQHPLGAYGEALARTEPISRHQEQALAEQIQKGDLEARNKLIQANLRFVVEVAAKYKGRGLSFEELISAGNEGLIIAAERFDGTRGIKFISYAVWWIRQSIQQALLNQSRFFRIPPKKQDWFKKIRQTTHTLSQKHEKMPTMGEIALEMDALTEEVKDMLVTTNTPRSLTEPINEEGLQLMDFLPDTQQAPPDASTVARSSQAVIDQALQRLDERERHILRLYFGLDGHEPVYLEKIGAMMNLTRERVRQLKERALTKLRSPEIYQALYATTAS